MTWVAQYGQWYCHSCKQYRGAQPQAQRVAAPTQQARTAARTAVSGALWYQNHYRLRKKVIAIANQYWIENAAGQTLGYSRQKIIAIKEKIRIFTDEKMHTELFRVEQQQILDIWGTFAVTDSATNTLLGYVRRKALKSGFIRDEWELQDPWKRPVGGIYEKTGRGLMRKYLPGGGLIPEKTTLELNGQPVAEINQDFKIVGDIWNIQCYALPHQFDRRVLLGCALLMSMIERDRK
jgi:uncharacterized protein YxjI